VGCGCMGVWVCGCVGVWVCGCVGVWVWGRGGGEDEILWWHERARTLLVSCLDSNRGQAFLRTPAHSAA
jgi:hypothetical protein